MIHMLWQLFVLACCLIGLLMAYSLLVRLIKTALAFFNELVDTAVAIFFFLLIVPLVWLWEKGRRPMWRTLTPRELEVLIKGVKR